MSFKAIAQGFPVLDEVPKYFPNFPYVTWAARPAWAKDHSDLVIAFIKAQQQGQLQPRDPDDDQSRDAMPNGRTRSWGDNGAPRRECGG